jgi:hypothetical protein
MPPCLDDDYDDGDGGAAVAARKGGVIRGCIELGASD